MSMRRRQGNGPSQNKPRSRMMRKLAFLALVAALGAGFVAVQTAYT